MDEKELEIQQTLTSEIPSNDPNLKPGMWRKPKEGFQWNPVSSFPRNAPCPCGSGIKFKKCHLSKISPVIDDSKKIDDVRKFVKLVKESRKK